MIRNSILLAAFLLACTPKAEAKNTCNTAPYTKVMPAHVGLTFGMSIDDAYKAAERIYGRKGIVRRDKGNVIVNIRGSQQDLFDQIAFIQLNGRVVTMAWSYANSFQDKLGGPAEALTTLVKKVKAEIGLADDARKIDSGFKFVWNEKGGLSTTITGEDPYKIFFRFTCETLEEAERAKVRQNVNLGF
jgi:hypothetical protein